jgi:site-specific DNA recombinase
MTPQSLIAAIYARKSTDQNLPDAEKSVTRQVEHATAYAARKGWTVDPAHVYTDDAVSGAEFVKRPGLARLLAALTRPAFSVVIMAEPSRLGREQIETAYTLKRITDAGAAVWYYLDDRRAAMDTALAKVMASLSGFASESEREQARARTYDALARKAKAGHVVGGLVYGYTNHRTDAGHVERRIHDAQAAVVRRIFTDYAQGTGPRGIAGALMAEGAPPPQPRRRDVTPGWSPAAVREILRRPLYAGRVTWGRARKTDRGGRTRVRVARPQSEWITVEVPTLRLIDEPTWQAVQARRMKMAETQPAGTWTRSPALGQPSLLAGLARCQCGAPLTRRGRPHGSGRRRRRVFLYGCASRTRPGSWCGNRVELLERHLDEPVLEALAKALSSDAIEQAVQVAMQDARAALAGSSTRRGEIDRDLRGIAARVGRLTEAIAAGTGAAAPLLEKLAAEESRRVALIRERDILDASAKTIDLTSGKVLRAIRQRADDIRSALLTHREEAADVLRAFVSRIDCTPFGSGRGRGYRFKGTGDYGALFGETFPARGVPDGTTSRDVWPWRLTAA